MTINQFIDKWLGKKADYDGYYGGQCVDLYRFYVKEVLGLKQSPGVGGAAEIWDSADPDDYDFIDNSPTAVPKNGDIVIWNRRAGGGFGHVDIFLNGDVNSFIGLDQNWPTLDKVTKTTHSYTNIIGWLRPKKNIMTDCLLPATEENKKLFERIVANSTKYDEFFKNGYKTIDDVRTKISIFEQQLKGRDLTLSNLNQILSDKDGRISVLTEQISTKDSLLLEKTTRLNSLLEQSKKIPEMVTQIEHLTEQKTQWNKTEITYNRAMGQLRAENKDLRDQAWKVVVRVMFEELIKKIKSINPMYTRKDKNE